MNKSNESLHKEDKKIEQFYEQNPFPRHHFFNYTNKSKQKLELINHTNKMVIFFM